MIHRLIKNTKEIQYHNITIMMYVYISIDFKQTRSNVS